jgi:hypothetical protein
MDCFDDVLKSKVLKWKKRNNDPRKTMPNDPFLSLWMGIGTQKMEKIDGEKKIVALGAPGLVVLLSNEAAFHRDSVHGFGWANATLI